MAQVSIRSIGRIVLKYTRLGKKTFPVHIATFRLVPICCKNAMGLWKKEKFSNFLQCSNHHHLLLQIRIQMVWTTSLKNELDLNLKWLAVSRYALLLIITLCLTADDLYLRNTALISCFIWSFCVDLQRWNGHNSCF